MGEVVSDQPSLWLRLMFGRHPRRTLIRLFVLVSLSFILFRFVFIPIRVSGFSMLPTYKDGRVNFVNHLAYRWKTPKRGDVIAFRFWPDNVVLLKRIVGLPGERVSVARGRILIDGVPLDEPYARFDAHSLPNNPDQVLARGEYYVIGDNRANTVQGPIHLRSILGRVVF